MLLEKAWGKLIVIMLKQLVENHMKFLMLLLMLGLRNLLLEVKILKKYGINYLMLKKKDIL
jgi:hypothetical protein